MKSGELKVRQRTCLDGTFSFQTLWFGQETRVGRSETLTCIKPKNILDSIFVVVVTSVRKPKTKLSKVIFNILSLSFPCHPVLESALNLFWTFITVFVPAGEWA